MSNNLPLKRLRFADQFLSDADNIGSIKDRVEEFLILVKRSGFEQTIAFFMSKKDEHKALINQLSQWLRERGMPGTNIELQDWITNPVRTYNQTRLIEHESELLMLAFKDLSKAYYHELNSDIDKKETIHHVQ